MDRYVTDIKNGCYQNPVSYTHLDVYKRQALQLQINPHFLYNTLQTLDMEARKLNDDGRISAVAVSYTHLDVYKRQVMDEPVQQTLPEPEPPKVELIPETIVKRQDMRKMCIRDRSDRPLFEPAARYYPGS